MTYFAFCIHNHQPVGNFSSVLEEAYEKSYWPFLQALSRHPAIKLTLHNSGFLIDWLVANRPEYVELLRSMTASGQVEVMGGGYYEPILSVIPERDRAGQISLMSDRIEAAFGARPRGLWLAERVWEPALPSTLKAAGVEYIVVDDFHFIKSGLMREELGGYYITEDQGSVIRVFPGSEALRYLIPFKPVPELLAHLKGLGGFLKRGNAAIYGDDGEKFGVWPGTAKWVFDDGWLEAFFQCIEGSLAWLRPATFSECMDAEEPLGRVYLPTTSYMEMGGWTLPAKASRAYEELVEEIKGWPDGDRVRRFIQGGAWRNFQAKYPESNWMHKRMLLASSALAGATGPDADTGRMHLYKAQANDAYWHGVFGGLYLPHLRTSVYEHLIKAEASLGSGIGPINVADIDADGHDEIRLRTDAVDLFLSPRIGGALLELDYRPKAVNFCNTLARWFEGYHHKLGDACNQRPDAHTKSIHDIVKVKEAGLERYLSFDGERRVSFRDHFLDADATLAAFFSNECRDIGGFKKAAYSARFIDKGVSFERHGVVEDGSAVVVKEYRMTGADSFSAGYRVSAKAHAGLRFGVELNLLLPCCDGPACYYEFGPAQCVEVGIGLGQTGELSGISSVRLVDTYTGVSLGITVSGEATLWRFPVYTVSLSEDGFEKIYQGSCLVFLFPLGHNGLDVCFDIKASSLSDA
ncbi:MAG: DUF1926 domain-containing protein [Deltaproteobacteria bacterium]|nr:DUF1926 domain-containing protein [Deltaproteobacteria bacterium]